MNLPGGGGNYAYVHYALTFQLVSVKRRFVIEVHRPHF